MIGFLLRLLPWWVWAMILSGLAAWGGIGLWRAGADSVRTDWQAADLARDRAEADRRREDARITRAAGREFEAWRADQVRRQAEVAAALSYALRTPASCPPSGELGDIKIPQSVVDLLRRAGENSEASAVLPTPAGL